MRFLPGERRIYAIIWIVLLGINGNIFSQPVIYPFVEEGKIGYKDSTGQVVVDPQYDYIEEFIQGQPWTIVGIGRYEMLSHAIDQKKLNFEGKFGLIDQKGNLLFEPVFNIIWSLDPEYAIVGNGTGHIHFENFPEGRNYEFKGDLGVMNAQGDTVVPVQYQTIQRLTSANQIYWLARNQEGNDLYTFEKKRQLNRNIESVDDFSEGLARFKSSGGNYGFIDTTGQTVIQPIFSKATSFIRGRAWVKKQDEYFFINKNSERIDSSYFVFDEMGPFSDGLALVRVFDEYGFIYPDSTFFIRPVYSEAGNFFNGITYVAKVDSFGYIHQDGQIDMVQRYEKDPVIVDEIRKNQPAVLLEFEKMSCDCSDSSAFIVSFDSLDLTGFITIQLEALRWAPYRYYKYPQMLARVIAGEGTLAGRHDFNFNFLKTGSQPWESFKQKVLFVILKDQYLRSLTWKWIKPLYKKVFLSMPEQHREVYRKMVQYLSQYFQDYSKEQVEKFLADHPDQFAYQHWDGSTSPFRKVSALLERLIFIHQVLEPEDVQYWIGKIRDEMKNL